MVFNAGMILQAAAMAIVLDTEVQVGPCTF